MDGANIMEVVGTLTIFDAMILFILLVSMFIGFMRGFTCEALTLGAWGGAILSLLYVFPIALELSESIFTPGPITNIVTGIILFIATIVVLKLIARFIGDHVKKSAIGALDRSLGAFFGFLRGALVISAGYLALSYIIPYPKQSDWIRDARLHQVAAYGAEMLSTVLPEFGGADALGSNISISDIREQMPVGVDFDLKDLTDGQGYTDKLREGISDLIDTAGDEKKSEPT